MRRGPKRQDLNNFLPHVRDVSMKNVCFLSPRINPYRPYQLVLLLLQFLIPDFRAPVLKIALPKMTATLKFVFWLTQLVAPTTSTRRTELLFVCKLDVTNYLLHAASHTACGRVDGFSHTR